LRVHIAKFTLAALQIILATDQCARFIVAVISQATGAVGLAR